MKIPYSTRCCELPQGESILSHCCILQWEGASLRKSVRRPARYGFVAFGKKAPGHIKTALDISYFTPEKEKAGYEE